jgi:tetratricopeptide (TPR) repeat protein
LDWFDKEEKVLSAEFDENPNYCVVDPSDRIQVAKLAIEFTPDGDPQRWWRLKQLAAWSYRRFHHKSGQLEDLGRAITALDQALHVIPQGIGNNDRQAFILIRQAHCFSTRFEQTGASDDINRSIGVAEEAWRLVPLGQDRRLEAATILADSLMAHFKLGQDPHDLDRAIALGKDALGMISSSSRRKLEVTTWLTRVLSARFDHSEDPEDWDQLCQLRACALESIDLHDPEVSGQLEDLGLLLSRRSDGHKKVAYLDEAIRVLNTACRASLDRPEDRLRILGHLSDMHHRRFIGTKHMDDLYQAIDISTEILAKTPGSNSSTAKLVARMALVDRLEDMINHQFLHHQVFAMSDVSRATEEMQVIVDLTPEGGTDRCNHLNRLSRLYNWKYSRTSSKDDLLKSIDAMHEALNDTSHAQDPIVRVARLTDMADRLRHRSKLAWQRGIENGHDLHGAINNCFEALDLITTNLSVTGFDAAKAVASSNPENYPLRAPHVTLSDDRGPSAKLWKMHLSHTSATLADCYYGRFEQSNKRNLEALDMHIKYLQASTENRVGTGLAPEYFRLGVAFQYRSRLAKTEASKDRNTEQAVHFLKESLDVPGSAPVDQFHSWGQLADIYSKLGQWDKSLKMWQRALVVVPHLSRAALSSSDQFHSIQGYSGWSCRMCSVALNAGADLAYALELLESGRGMVAGSFLEAQVDVSMLDPDQASAFAKAQASIRNLRGQRNIASDRSSNSQQFQADRDAEEDIRDVIHSLRTNPKTTDFLRPPSVAQLLEVLGDDTIVIINTNDLRCDAFLINKNCNARLLRLEKVTQKAVSKGYKDLISARPSMSLDMLAWLWTDVAHPIVKELGFIDPSRLDRMPRLIWVLTGKMSHFPIHAAGIYSQHSSTAVMDHVVSSYSSSLRAFTLGRQKQLRISRSQKALLIGMSETWFRPDLAKLPYAFKEVEELARICPSLGLSPVNLQQPRKDTVLSHLSQCAVLHFAGHGLSDPLDPSRSGLLLADDCLTVSDLLDHNLQDQVQKPFLGFLSACLTGSNEAELLLDEAAHLINAFQLIGFRHVVGTLWQVSDNICVEVAVRVYTKITKSDMAWVDDSVARGLHCALVMLRNDWLKRGGSSDRGDGGQGGNVKGKSKVTDDCDNVADEGKEDYDEGSDSETGFWAEVGTQEDARNGRARHARVRLRRQNTGKLVNADWIPFVHYGP